MNLNMFVNLGGDGGVEVVYGFVVEGVVGVVVVFY